MSQFARLRELTTVRSELETAIESLRSLDWSVGEAEVALVCVVEMLEVCPPRDDAPNDLQEFVLERIGRLLGDLRVVMDARKEVEARQANAAAFE